MKIVILSRVVSSIGKDPRRILEGVGSKDAWDETNIACCGFGPKGIMGFGPKLFGIQKKKKIDYAKNHFYVTVHNVNIDIKKYIEYLHQPQSLLNPPYLHLYVTSFWPRNTKIWISHHWNIEF